MVSDIVSEPPTKKTRYLISSTINAADNSNLAEKLKITQEQECVASSTPSVEEVFVKNIENIYNLLY